ncbi:quinone oxidoreductase family protein [Microbacterium sp. 22242]|uniref:quinone oxidoreductase family protein n=1 Tax=Microbacterium sp. 22242 TaxID=3453896 RepID=UPI003F87605B
MVTGLQSTPAVRVHAVGGPDALVFADYPLAPIGPADVLVQIDTATVSGWDVKYRAGRLSGNTLPGRGALPLPQQLGREGAGVVIAVGPQVRRSAPGDRVVGVVHPENPYDAETYRGLGNLSSGIDVPGHVGLGSYAKYVVRDERLWIPLPPHVELELAAVTLWSYGTAHRLVHDRLHLHVGATLLVCGATGGMGEATIRLARLSGARVIATTRHAAKADALHELGVEHVIVTDDPRTVVDEVRRWSGTDGVSHAVDYTGDGAQIRLAIDALRLGGVFSPASGTQVPRDAPSPIRVNDFTHKELTMIGIRGARHADALAVLDLLAQDLIRPRIAARFPLAEAAAAHALHESGAAPVGRIVLKP